MEGIVWGGISPHPPLIIPAIGQNDIRQVFDTCTGMTQLARSLREAKPQVCVLISPHGPFFYDGLPVWDVPHMEGSFAHFGFPNIRFGLDIDQTLAKAIVEVGHAQGISFISLDESMIQRTSVRRELDHGVLVPWFYIRQEGIAIPAVIISMGMLTYQELFRAGKAIQTAAKQDGRRIAILASGDMSHALSQSAPSGYNPAGKEFDETLVAMLRENRLQDILTIDPALIERAAECGYRPVTLLLGALDGLQVKTQVHSYEGPYGVGYLTASMEVAGETDSAHMPKSSPDPASETLDTSRTQEHPLVQLARNTLEAHIHQKPFSPPDPLPSEWTRRAGAFVSIKKMGQLRGCIGTISAVRENLAMEVMANAISAGTEDPRFYPVTVAELPHLVYSVDVLMEPEPVTDRGHLDVHRYGIIVRQGRRTGLLLPDLPGIEKVDDQIQIACQKAGIDPDGTFTIERFEVIRYQ